MHQQTEAAAVTDAAPINAWAARVTNGLIKQAVDPAADFNLVLTNAVYFKAHWQYSFASSKTINKPFKALVNTPGSAAPTQEVVMVDTMKQLFKPELGRSATQKPAFAEVPGRYQAVRLVYKESPGLAAIFVLPDSSIMIKEAAAAITAQELLQPQSWTPVTADTLPNGLELSLPKFRVEVKQLSQKKVTYQRPALQAALPRGPGLCKYHVVHNTYCSALAGELSRSAVLLREYASQFSEQWLLVQKGK